jgi:hypothetical protein
MSTALVAQLRHVEASLAESRATVTAAARDGETPRVIAMRTDLARLEAYGELLWTLARLAAGPPAGQPAPATLMAAHRALARVESLGVVNPEFEAVRSWLAALGAALEPARQAAS